MKPSIILAAASALAMGSAHALAQEAETGTLVRNIDVFDVESGLLIQGRDVYFEGGIVAFTGPTGESDAPASARVIDGRGMTLLPGLINSHVHLTGVDGAAGALEAMFALGITTVRDLGGDTRPLAALERQRREGERLLPELVYAAVLGGPPLMTDQRAIFSSQGFEPGEAPWMRAVTAESDLSAIIADARATGATGVKVYASLEADLLREIVEEAHAQGMLVWMHSVIFPANGADVVAAGPDQIIHTKGLASADDTGLPDNFADGVSQYMPRLPFAERPPTDAFYEVLFADMAGNGIMLDPSLMADGDLALALGREVPEPILALRDWACAATGAAWRAGVMVGAGTDYAGQDDLFLRELDRLVECGVSRSGALVAATWNNARALGIHDRTGRIAPGYEADLLLVEGDPTEDLAALRNVRAVFSDGRDVTPVD